MTQKVPLTSNQKKALAALLSSRSVTEAARRCSLSRRTLVRYLADDEFNRELVSRENALLDAGLAALAGELGTCFETIASVRDDDQETGSVRLRAVALWVDTLLKLADLRTVQARIERLEEVFFEQP